MSSSLGAVAKKEPEIVIFKDPTHIRPHNFKRKNDKSFKKPDNSTKKLKHQQKDFRYGNLKREVSKLALSAYKGRERREAVESYLIKLGAHPIKRKKYQNYKEFLENRKNEDSKEKIKNTEKFREEKLKKLITKAHKSIVRYNKLSTFKKKSKKSK
ncbi:hypothetical protein Ahia01_000370200 [Argonauta hians]